MQLQKYKRELCFSLLYHFIERQIDIAKEVEKSPWIKPFRVMIGIVVSIGLCNTKILFEEKKIFVNIIIINNNIAVFSKFINQNKNGWMTKANIHNICLKNNRF